MTKPLLILILFTIGCSTTKCKTVKHQKEIDATHVNADKLKKTFNVDQKKNNGKEEHVFIYKYDGALQCGLGHAVKVQVMEQELTGITVYSRENKPDGLMHVQACGQPTGRANVYEVSKSNADKAKSRGFLLWRFN